MVKAKETNLEGVLEGKKQYQVPLYQRVYGWGKTQIDQLWDDLMEITEARQTDPSATHFIGSLVLAASPDISAVGVQKFLVVDGQQRLTTLTILLAALRDHQVEVSGAAHRERIDTLFLVNKFEPGEPTKVLPTQADRDSYLSVIRAMATAGSEDAVGNAYRSFRSKIAVADDPDDDQDIKDIENAVLRGLALVAVTAERGDNAHRIFESLNNTGLRLTQSDLIKNYLFMRLGERAEPVYETVWLPLEELLDSSELELLFWLDLVRTDEKATQADMYIGQQRRLEKLTSKEIEAEVARVAKLGVVLAAILDPGRETDAAVRLRLRRLRLWGSTTAYPVILQLLVKRESGEATSQQVARALLSLESYFVRRIVIGRATAGLNRTLLQAAAAIADAGPVDEALLQYLSGRRRYFGTDAKVRDAAQTVPFYWQGRAAQRKLILQWIEESYGSKEPIDPATLTIEHVLPQTLSDLVRDEFGTTLPELADPGSEHERLVHTLGNLTLTGYNSELSNRPFSRKREMLKTSGIRMNQEIAAQSEWGPEEIDARGARIAERIIELWPGPDESVPADTGEDSDLRRTVKAVVAIIPAGRWTSYGEVALVAGSHPVAVGTVLTHVAMLNAWRVLLATGAVAPQFTWPDSDRTDDPKDLLEAEGIEFDASGRAVREQFVMAEELAELAGLDVVHRGDLPARQLEFWSRVVEWGGQHSEHISSWRPASSRYWLPLPLLVPGVGVELDIYTVEPKVSAELYLHDDKGLFARLFSLREMIESELGLELEWREQPERKASRIMVFHPGDFRDETAGPELIEWLVTTADNLTRVFRAYL